MAEVTTGELKCFKNDVIDWVISETREEATEILLSVYGGELEEETDGSDYWEEVDSGSEITITDENLHGGKQKKTVAEWIKEHGKGFLCSTEY